MRNSLFFPFQIIIILLCMPLTLAEIDIFDADKATLELTITGEADFTATGSGGYVSEATAELSWIPRNTYNQRMEEYTTQPQARVRDTATYSWTKPALGKQTITFEALISTNNDITPVTKELPFPLAYIEADLIPYTQPSAMIDHNADIGALASQLAMGKDEQYEVVFALADWVTTNIEYDLNTITANAVYPSSWVLENGYGVCDEMTNLFISMNRALGIPARFVSGIAYTDLEGIATNWGGHGWAEVYFPTVGWIPFDVTYGEYGFVDAGHIKLKDSIDSKETSLEFRGTGYNFRIDSQPLDFDVDVLGTSPKKYEFIQVDIEPYAQDVGFGSYNLLTMTIKNLREYYVSTRIELGETTQMRHASSDEQNVLLHPHEEREIHFLVRVDEDLSNRYVYTFPIVAYTKLGDPAETSFRAESNGPIFSQEAFASYFDETDKEIANVEILCFVETPVKQTAEINCTFTPEEPTSGRVCIDTACTNIELDLAPKTHTTKITKDEPGIYTIPVTFSNRQVQKTQFVTLHVLDDTSLTISNVDLPATVRFGEQVELAFTIERTSASTPISNRVSVLHEKFAQEWTQENILSVQDFHLTFTGERLNPGDNLVLIEVEFQDAFGEWHTITSSVPIALVDLTLEQRIILWIDSVDQWLQDMFA